MLWRQWRAALASEWEVNPILDAIADYDEVHGTFTVCMVWREREIVQNGVR